MLSRTSSYGFTAIELLAVLLLVGVFVGLALPKIEPARFHVEAAAHTVGATLLGAQRLAPYYEVDPVGFDVASYFDLLTEGP